MDLDEWQPSADTPFSFKSFGPPDAGQRLKAMRTSLLFSELVREQNLQREAERQALQDRDYRELRISAELAARFPMCTDDYDDSASVSSVSTNSEATEMQTTTTVGAAEELCLEVCSKAAACRRDLERPLPAPLTAAGLEKAFSQLPEGACNTLHACMQCWHTGRLSNSDVLETVRSFSSSSPALQKIFSSAVIPLPVLHSGALGEVATDEDMFDLALLAQA